MERMAKTIMKMSRPNRAPLKNQAMILAEGTLCYLCQVHLVSFAIRVETVQTIELISRFPLLLLHMSV